MQVHERTVPLYVQTRARLALALCTHGYGQSRRCPPVAAHGLDGLALGGELAQPVENPPSAHPGNRDELADGNALRGRTGKRVTQDAVRILVPFPGRVAGIGRRNDGLPRAFAVNIRRPGFDGSARYAVEPARYASMHRARGADRVVAEQIGACPPGNVMLGCRDEELSGCVELVGSP